MYQIDGCIFLEMIILKRLLNVVFFLLLLEVILFPIFTFIDIHKQSNRNDAFDVVVEKYGKYNFLTGNSPKKDEYGFDIVPLFDLLPANLDKKLYQMISDLSDKYSQLPTKQICKEHICIDQIEKDITTNITEDAQDILFREKILKLQVQEFIIFNLLCFFALLIFNYIFFGKITLFHKK